MKRSAFTLIELLVVIAIIAILAAIIFPVFARAKMQAAKNGDLARMNELRNALQLYRADQGAYPPALLGYVTLYTSGPNMGNVVPANQIHGPLYPRRIDSFDILKPSQNKFANTDISAAVWPSQDPRQVGTAPILDLNGDGSVNGADDVAEARQAFGPPTIVQRPDPSNPGNLIDAQYYLASGYDMEQVRTPSNALRNELRYTLFWTVWGLGGGHRLDDPRQLGYNDPPESTVVTWHGAYRDLDGSGVPRPGRGDIVLFLGGSAKTYDSRALYDRSWRVMP